MKILIKHIWLVLVAFMPILTNAQSTGFDIYAGYGQSAVRIPGYEKTDLLKATLTSYNLKLHLYRSWLGLETNVGIGNSPFLDNFQASMSSLGYSAYWDETDNWKSAYLTIGPSIRLLDSKLGWTINPSVGFLTGLNPDITVSTGSNSQVSLDAINRSKPRLTYGVGSSITYQFNTHLGVHVSGQYHTTHPFQKGEVFDLESYENSLKEEPVAFATDLLKQDNFKSDFSNIAWQIGLSIHLGAGSSSGSRGNVFSIPINSSDCFKDCRNERYNDCKDSQVNCGRNYRRCKRDARRVKRNCKRNCSGSWRAKRRCKRACRQDFRTTKQQCKIVRRQCRSNRTTCRKKDFNGICKKECQGI